MTLHEMKAAKLWLTRYFLMSLESGFHEAYLLIWDRQRVEMGIPSIYG